MAINQTRYVKITSGIGGDSIVANRELKARVFTQNSLLYVDGSKVFTSASAVMSYFGDESEEYNYASRYFSFVSKNITSPRSLEFVFWTSTEIESELIPEHEADVDNIAALFPSSSTVISAYITLGGHSDPFEINLYNLTTLDAMATALTTAIRAIDSDNDYSTVQVSNVDDQLVVFAGNTEDLGYFAVDTSQTEELQDVTEQFLFYAGWSEYSGAKIVEYHPAQTPAEAFVASVEKNNNFGSFSFIGDLTVAEVAAVAIANNNTDYNNMFLFSARVSDQVTAGFIRSELGESPAEGLCLTYVTANGREEYMPMAILAATDYTAVNSTQNFMYQQFSGAVASVYSDSEADEWDALSVNYYGQTQAAGQGISFYQRGVLQGKISDIGVYCNEIWLKDALTVNILNLLLASPKVPANNDGKAMVRGVMQESIDTALINGTIIKMKTLSAIQKSYIQQLTGDTNAWLSVYNDGYYLMIDIKPRDNANSGKSEYMVSYKLIYSKGDSVKYVEGSDIMI